MANDNKLLGNFDLGGIPPAPRGIPQIEVTFDIDANGIAHVTAKDKATGKQNNVTIQGQGGLSQADIDNMIKQAEAMKEEDKKKKESIEVRNVADTTIYETEKTLNEHKSKLSAELISEIEKDLQELRDAISQNDATKMREASNKVKNGAMKIGQAIYSQSQGQGQQQQQSEQTSQEGQQGQQQENQEKK